MLNQLFGVETGVGDVAASTAGDADFVQGMAAGFEEGDVEVGVVLGGGDSPKEAGGPSADDEDVVHGLTGKWFRDSGKWGRGRMGQELSREVGVLPRGTVILAGDRSHILVLLMLTALLLMGSMSLTPVPDLAGVGEVLSQRMGEGVGESCRRVAIATDQTLHLYPRPVMGGSRGEEDTAIVGVFSDEQIQLLRTNVPGVDGDERLWHEIVDSIGNRGYILAFNPTTGQSTLRFCP